MGLLAQQFLPQYTFNPAAQARVSKSFLHDLHPTSIVHLRSMPLRPSRGNWLGAGLVTY
jgi:hypothetical protein